MTKLVSSKNIRRQGGFTLVELAIVMVIAGIILAAVLKGTDMINKAKVQRMTADLRGLQGMILGAEKRTGNLPGDCDGDGIINYTPPTVTSTLPAFATAYSTSEDPDTAGRCVNATTAENNQNLSWSDMRKANIVDPSRTNRNLAKNILNDFYAIGSVTPTVNNPTASPVNVIVVYGIPLWMAKALDVQIDGPQNDPADPLAGGGRGRIRLFADSAGLINGGGGGDWPSDKTGGGDYQLVSISYEFDTRMAQPTL